MIVVNVKVNNDKISSLTVSGHAQYANPGKDIVCAGVSSVITGGINALEKYLLDILLINEKNKLGVKVIKDSNEIQIILNTILTQLQTIAESYPKNVTINKE